MIMGGSASETSQLCKHVFNKRQICDKVIIKKGINKFRHRMKGLGTEKEN